MTEKVRKAADNLIFIEASPDCGTVLLASSGCVFELLVELCIMWTYSWPDPAISGYEWPRRCSNTDAAESKFGVRPTFRLESGAFLVGIRSGPDWGVSSKQAAYAVIS